MQGSAASRRFRAEQLEITMQSKRSFPIPMPSEIQAQEGDIERMFRQLIKNFTDTQRQSAGTQGQELAACILIVILGLLSVCAFYLLYLKTSGNCSFSFIPVCR